MAMIRVMLDTSAYSAFMRGHPEVYRIVQQADEISFCPIVLGELFAGFSRGTHKKKNDQELKQFLSSPRVTHVSMDEGTAERYAVILTSLFQAGTPIPTNDLWIAASTMQHGLRLVTTDRHFQKVPQIIIDYLGV